MIPREHKLVERGAESDENVVGGGMGATSEDTGENDGRVNQ